MKSRFFVADGLLVDVSKIVSITYPTKGNPQHDCRIGFEDASSVYPDRNTAERIAAAVVEWEAELHSRWAAPMRLNGITVTS